MNDKTLDSSIWVIEHLNAFSCLTYILAIFSQHINTAGQLKIYYIDSTTLGARISRWAGVVLKIEFNPLNYRLMDIKDEEGCFVRLKVLFKEVDVLNQKITENPLFQDFLAKVVGQEQEALKMFIRKNFMDALTKDRGNSLFFGVLIVNIISHYFSLQLQQGQNITLWLCQRVWMKELASYAKDRGLVVKTIFTWSWDFKKIINLMGKYRLRKLGVALFVFYHRCFKKKTPLLKVPLLWNTMHPKLAVDYYGNLNLDDPCRHSDLFFWPPSGIKGENTLVIFKIPHYPATPFIAKQINTHGFASVALNPKVCKDVEVPLFNPMVGTSIPSPMDAKVRKYKGDSFERNWLKQQVFDFYQERNYWIKFFEATQTKAYMTWYKYGSFHCMMADALKYVGGVSAVYQRAFEEQPRFEIAVVADIVFGFSPKCFDIERTNGSRIGYHVITGYIGDYRFSYLKQPAQMIRQELMRHGAKNIIAFFDENSSSDTRWYTGHELTRQNYAFLLEKILTNSSIGLILKPKVPTTLRKRLGPVAKLLEDAQSTGRCWVLEEGLVHGAHGALPPSLAALASDIAIHGHLQAATAAVESTLAGVPTLLMDREGWPHSSLNRLGRGQTIFMNWESAWSACQESFNGNKAIGSWSTILDELDPFRDGKASERIGVYLRWIMEGFLDQLPRQQILANAAERYAILWGKDKIISPVNTGGKL